LQSEICNLKSGASGTRKMIPAGCSAELYQYLLGQGVRDCEKCLGQAGVMHLTGEKVEIYSFQTDAGDLFAWDVAAILHHLQEVPVEPRVLSRAELERLHQNQLCRNRVVPAHLDHVDPQEPGLAVLVDGKAILIDGTHRCLRAWRDGLPFAIRVLPKEIADRFLLCKPPQTLADLAEIKKARATALVKTKKG
jgi:hypothetical protein